MGIPVYGLVDTNSNPNNLTNFIPINDDSSKTIKFVLNYLAQAVKEGQESARKQGLVQKLEGEGGPKVFSLNSTTQKVPAKADSKSQQENISKPTIVESEEAVKKVSKASTKAAPKKTATKAAPKKTAAKAAPKKTAAKKK